MSEDVRTLSAEEKKRTLIKRMEKAGIPGLHMDMSVAELKGIFVDFKGKAEQREINNHSKEWAMDQLRKHKLKKDIEFVNRVLVPPRDYKQIREHDISKFTADGEIITVILKKGGKYKYNIRTGYFIK